MAMPQGTSMYSILSLGNGYRQTEESLQDDMTNDDLRQALDDVLQRNYILALENEMFERYLSRHDPESLKNVAQVLEKTKQAQRVAAQFAAASPRLSLTMSASVTSLPDKTSSSIGSGYSGSRSGNLLASRTFGPGFKITTEERIEIAKNEVADARKKLAVLLKTDQRRKLFLTAKREELELRISEANEASDDFEEEIVILGTDPLTGKIPAERIVKFIEDWLKTADGIIERLRLKSATIKLQIKKAKQQLIRREDLGEALHAIDFEQLNIENEDCVRRIEEKNRYLLEVKRTAGRYGLQLTKHKQRLNELLHALDTVRREIAMKQQQIRKLEAGHAVIETDVRKMKGQLTSLLSLMENYEVPDILDFIKLKDEFQMVQKIHKILSRRKKLQEIMSKSAKRQTTG